MATKHFPKFDVKQENVAVSTLKRGPGLCLFHGAFYKFATLYVGGGFLGSVEMCFFPIARILRRSDVSLFV